MATRSHDDRITLSGLKLQPRIGTTPEERSAPQPCEADITVWGDFEAAATTDDLEHALDYTRIVSVASACAHERPYNLVESMAYSIVRSILRSCAARRVNVRVRKRPESLKDQIDFVEIEVEES
jgi:dihydroneopterin aldolase